MLNATVLPRKWTYVSCVFIFVLLRDQQNISLGVFDKCFLVLIHTPLFLFVRPLTLLISNNFTCFYCFVMNRSLHQILTKGGKRTCSQVKKWIPAKCVRPHLVRLNALTVARWEQWSNAGPVSPRLTWMP
jgi:hypothetical protein